MIVIRNIRLLDPATGRDQQVHILLHEERIFKILPAEEGALAAGETGSGEAPLFIEGEGLIAAPGLVDCHVHFRDPGQTEKEDLLSGAAAAAKGGYTTVICMANTLPPIDSVELLLANRKKAREAPIRVLQAATITKGMAGKELVDMEALHEAGAPCFTDDGKPLMDKALARVAMHNAAALGTILSFHEEDPAYVETAGVNRGPVSEALAHDQGAAAEAEHSMVARDVQLARLTGARIDIQHVSSAETVELLRKGIREGADLWAEATPHHFSLTEEALRIHGSNAKINPPLRTEEDRQAILKGLRDNSLNLIATDHAPHSAEEKARPFPQAPSGIVGLETALALGITHLVEPGILSLSQLLAKMSCQPAECFHLNERPALTGIEGDDPPGIGRLVEGGAADLVLFDPREEWTLRAEDLRSRSKNSPFLGETLRGRVKYTLCRGKIVYQDE